MEQKALLYGCYKQAWPKLENKKNLAYGDQVWEKGIFMNFTYSNTTLP